MKKGYKFTEEEKRLKYPAEWCKKHSERMKGNSWNTGKKHSAERCKKIGDAKKGKSRPKHSVEWRKKIGEARIKFILENGSPGGYKHVKRGIFCSIKNRKEIKYDSGLELSAYLLLEQLFKVKSYSRCNFSIPYSYKGTQHKYIPDILVAYIDEVQEVIEIKPKYLAEEEQNIAKFNAAVPFCNENNLKFNVWTELYINQLNNFLKEEVK